MKKAIRAHYNHRISPDRPNYDVLDWASEGSQQARFEVLADNVDLEGLALLDVGCGLGDLLAYLESRNLRLEYTGVDLLEEMVQAARQRHPHGRFVCADVFSNDNPFAQESFDVVFCSGIFNLNLGNNEQFLAAALGRLMELSRDYTVFNLLHARQLQQDATYAYYHPSAVRTMLDALPCSYRLIDDYLPNDFTVVCRRQST